MKLEKVKPGEKAKTIGGMDAELFDSLMADAIEKGTPRKTAKIMDGFEIELKVLNSNELMDAESLAIAMNRNVPRDIVEKARLVSILASATTKINGVDMEREDPKDQLEMTNAILIKYGTLSPKIIDRMFGFYRTLEKKNDLLFENSDQIENF